jgi:hypothetical protein
MAIEDAIKALPEHLDDVLAQLGAEKAAELTELLGRLDPPGSDERQVLTRISGLLVAGLPARHPVRRALAGGYLLAPSAVDLAEVAAVLRQRLGAGAAAAVAGVVRASGPPAVSEILRAVTVRLLAAPAYSEEEVRTHGANPEDPALIRLRRLDGGVQWPAFQFAPGRAGPHPVVRVINGMLGAAADPVGAAGWWLSKNGWLDAQPSLLLGRGRDADDQLISAARAVGSEV